MMEWLRVRPLVVAVFVCSLGLLAIMFSFLFITNPDRLGPQGITLWFLGLYSGSIGLVASVLHMGINRLSRHKIGLAQAIRLSVPLLFIPTSLLALNSLHQLDFKDIVLVIVLVGVLEFYLRRR